MSKNPLLDEEFLKDLYLHRSREIFSKIIALTLEEDPVEEIQGQVTGGSINLDGSSNVRRTCNLTMVAKDLDINQYYWGLKSKFKLYIGLANNINKEYDDIIWFPMGTYVISNFTTSQSTNNYTISITGKDKMCLLNGDLGGSLFASVDFGKEEYYENGITTLSYIPIKNIIREAVHAYANEQWENIIINDLDDYGIELLDYRNTDPMYLFFIDGTSDNTKECENNTRDGDKKVYPARRVYSPDGTFTYEVTDTTGVALKDIGDIDGLYYDPRITLDLSGVSLTQPTLFCDINGMSTTSEIDTTKAYTIARIENGQTCGYRLTDITYPGDLILGVGEPITAMLDKLVAMLGNFEYFYNLDGRFVFQRKQTFVDKTWNNIRTGNQNSYVTTSDETYVESAVGVSPIFWTFGNSFLTTTYTNTPVLNNVKNDFSIWGTKKSVTGTELPVHLRYAVDKKPTYYKTIEYTAQVKQEDGTTIEEKRGGVEWTSEVGDWLIDKGGHIYNTEDLMYLLAGHEDYTEEQETEFFKNEGYRRVIRRAENLVDWREIIFQMALDYRKHNHEDDFYLKVRNTNGLDINGQWYYPNGKTGYEQYYTDMEGFWRGLYCPPQLMNKLFPEKDFNPIATGTWGNRPNGVYYDTGAIYADSEDGIYFNKSDGIMYNMNANFKAEYDLNGEWINSWVKNQDINDGWNIRIIDSPETLEFWFDFLEPDQEADLAKYSVPAIGDRAKSVNDNMVKAIYFRETPTALFTTNIQTVERKTGYTYLQYSPEMASLFNVSSQGKSAIDVMNEYINLYLYCVESISITSIPIYHLQPNVKVLVYDEDSKINGQYLVSRITIPLVYNGTMSVSATKSAEIVY